MWACVGSVTHKDHGRMPGIDAPGRHGGVDDSHSQSEGKRGHACACVLRRIQKSQKLHNTCIIYVALAVMSWSFPCFYRCTERVFFLLVVASGHVATLGGWKQQHSKTHRVFCVLDPGEYHPHKPALFHFATLLFCKIIFFCKSHKSEEHHGYQHLTHGAKWWWIYVILCSLVLCVLFTTYICIMSSSNVSYCVILVMTWDHRSKWAEVIFFTVHQMVTLTYVSTVHGALKINK